MSTSTVALPRKVLLLAKLQQWGGVQGALMKYELSILELGRSLKCLDLHLPTVVNGSPAAIFRQQSISYMGSGMKVLTSSHVWGPYQKSVALCLAATLITGIFYNLPLAFVFKIGCSSERVAVPVSLALIDEPVVYLLQFQPRLLDQALFLIFLSCSKQTHSWHETYSKHAAIKVGLNYILGNDK